MNKQSSRSLSQALNYSISSKVDNEQINLLVPAVRISVNI